MRTFAHKQAQPPKQVSSGLRRPQVTVPPPREHPLLRVQRAAGNQAVHRILRTNPEDARASQTKPTVTPPGDELEREANRLAVQVMGERGPFDSSPPEATRAAIPSPVAARHRTSGEQASETEDRRFFESRFNRDLADVRVSADSAANQSALDLQALSYTVGHQIRFASGECRPGTTAGRRLLAHELAHVLQQRRIHPPGSLLIQRQPKDEPAKAEQKTTSLKAAGVDLADPVSGKTAQIIDEVLLRSKKLAPYIGDKLKSGFRISGRLVKDTSDGDFETAYRKAYDLHKSTPVPAHIMGFYDYGTPRTIHLRPSAAFGTAFHEAIHSLASVQLYTDLPTVKKVSSHLVEVLTEGVTAYFTDAVVAEEGLTKWVDAYANLKADAAKLVAAFGKDGFDVMARFNFKYAIVATGNRLGLSTKQYGDLKGGGPKEVYQRMNDLL